MSCGSGPPALRFNVHSDQEAFDKVWNHYILHRHSPAVRDDGRWFDYYAARPHVRSPLSLLIPRSVLEALYRYYYHESVGQQVVVHHSHDALWKAGLNPDLIFRLKRTHYAAYQAPGSFRKAFAYGLRLVAPEYHLRVPNDADYLPTHWHTDIRSMPPGVSLKEAARQVPEMENWLMNPHGTAAAPAAERSRR